MSTTLSGTCECKENYESDSTGKCVTACAQTTSGDKWGTNSERDIKDRDNCICKENFEADS